ncbi:MAG: sulfotransferase family protein [Phycisphaerales bacterium]
MTTRLPPAATTTPARTARASAMRPVIAFITGCGRSGTTILTRLLGKHRDVTALNDQYMTWAQAWPQYDVAGQVPFDPAVHAPLELSEEHARRDPEAAARLRAMLDERREGRRVIVEKLAQNNMRLGFLRALYPDCLLINIVRHGVEVARSIEQRALKGRWYGVRERKWDCLAAHARVNGYGDLLALCTDPVHRGLLEWRMSVDAADRFFDRAGESGVLRVRYEQLVTDPIGVCEGLERFLGVAARPVMREFAGTKIARRGAPADVGPPPEHTEAIAGPALRRLGYAPPFAPTVTDARKGPA